MPYNKSKRADNGLRKSARRERQRKNRISNACEACKKRKTKCTGLPSPCTACASNSSFCHFSPKLDCRRKGSYKPFVIQENQQFFLIALLRTLKHVDVAELTKVLDLVRDPEAPEELARTLTQNFSRLQRKGILPPFDFTESDVLTLMLQLLFNPRGDQWPMKAVHESSDEESNSMVVMSESSKSRSDRGRSFSEGLEQQTSSSRSPPPFTNSFSRSALPLELQSLRTPARHHNNVGDVVGHHGDAARMPPPLMTDMRQQADVNHSNHRSGSGSQLASSRSYSSQDWSCGPGTPAASNFDWFQPSFSSTDHPYPTSDSPIREPIGPIKLPIVSQPQTPEPQHSMNMCAQFEDVVHIMRSISKNPAAYNQQRISNKSAHSSALSQPDHMFDFASYYAGQGVGFPEAAPPTVTPLAECTGQPQSLLSRPPLL